MIAKVLKKIKYILSALGNLDLKDNTGEITSCDVLLFAHDVDRGISLSGQAYSPILDSLKEDLERIGFRCISIAHPWSKLTGKLAYGEPIAINRSYFNARISKKIAKIMGADPVLSLFKKILKKSSPKIIVTIGCTDELCEAARDLNIFHVELLHGIGYATMPWAWDKKEKENLPQGILSLDDVSNKTFSMLEKHGVEMKRIPHPFLRRFRQDKIHLLPSEWLPTSKKQIYKKEVLVSLQWGYADGIDAYDCFEGILNNGLFYNELEEAVKQTGNTIYWRFRFHPVQYRQKVKYKKLFDYIEGFVDKYPNCDWQESTYIPLPGLLLSCSGHITMSSMSCYEAAYLGVRTLALCPSLRFGGVHETFFEDLVEKGYVLKQPPEINKILEWLQSVEKTDSLLNDLSRIEDNDDAGNWLSFKHIDLLLLRETK